MWWKTNTDGGGLMLHHRYALAVRVLHQNQSWEHVSRALTVLWIQQRMLIVQGHAAIIIREYSRAALYRERDGHIYTATAQSIIGLTG